MVQETWKVIKSQWFQTNAGFSWCHVDESGRDESERPQCTRKDNISNHDDGNEQSEHHSSKRTSVEII